MEKTEKATHAAGIRRAGPFAGERNAERGGIAILVSLMLIVLMAAAGFGASRSVIREVSVTGDAVQGAKSACSADAGLDWFAVWSYSKTAPLTNVYSTLKDLEDGQTLDANNQRTKTISAVGDMIIPKAADSQLLQNYDIQIRYLGRQEQPGMGRGGNAAGAQGTGTKLLDNLWQVTAVGHSTVLNDSNQPVFAFQSKRESVCSTPPQQ